MTAQEIAEKIGSYVPEARECVGEWFDHGRTVGVSLTIGGRHFSSRFPVGHSNFREIAEGIRERAIASGEIASC